MTDRRIAPRHQFTFEAGGRLRQQATAQSTGGTDFVRFQYNWRITHWRHSKTSSDYLY